MAVRTTSFIFRMGICSKLSSVPLSYAIDRVGFYVILNSIKVAVPALTISQSLFASVVNTQFRKQNELIVKPREHLKHHLIILYCLATLAVLGFIVGGYLYFFGLTDAEQRLTKIENALVINQTDLHAILNEFETRQTLLEQSLGDIKVLQNSVTAKLRRDFSTELNRTNQDVKQALLKNDEIDAAVRDKFIQNAKAKLAQLESQISEHLIHGMDQFAISFKELHLNNTARIESLERESTWFKDILIDSRNAVIFIKTSYLAQSLSTGEKRELEAFGTGFIVTTDGFAVAPKHVVYPWLYDQDMLALEALGLVRIVPGSVVNEIWTAEEQVIELTAEDEQKYLTSTAFSTKSEDKKVDILFSPKSEYGTQTVVSPIFGTVKIRRPQYGNEDIVILKLTENDRPFAALDLSEETDHVGAMDEVLLVGYPLSRLQDGRSIPQGINGFVRRSTEDTLELDIAIHAGSSGAPVIAKSATVIGMAAAITDSSYGYAIPAGHLLSTITEAKKLQNK